MKKRLQNKIGGFFKTKFLTIAPQQLYDVIAVNKKNGTIVKIGTVSTIDEAVRLTKENIKLGFSYYLLTDEPILTELPTR
tara:strand:+ start:1040 stop:1279 length:240 start_codon:yes stop_codon:yes gene_type:complete